MLTTLSPQIRVIALVGLLAAAALVASTQLVLRGMIFSSDSEPTAVSAAVSAPADKAPAKAKARATKVAPAGTKRSATTPSTKSAAATAAAARAPSAAERPLRTHGLPVPLARALQNHRVVVVSLFAPNATVDRIAKAEAEAGAEAAGVGFVALNVLERKNAEPLGTKLGVINAPSVLVYTRPAKLFVELGLADTATVAQAADNARR